MAAEIYFAIRWCLHVQGKNCLMKNYNRNFCNRTINDGAGVPNLNKIDQVK